MTEPERAPLSVIVPTCGRPDLLDGALSSLRDSLADIDELVVVESGSAQPEPVWAVARRHGATLLVADAPGVSKARNLGWRQARHDHVAFIDDDIRVQPGWANAMAAGLSAHPGAAFVSGRIDLRGPYSAQDAPAGLRNILVQLLPADPDQPGDTAAGAVRRWFAEGDALRLVRDAQRIEVRLVLGGTEVPLPHTENDRTHDTKERHRAP